MKYLIDYNSYSINEEYLPLGKDHKFFIKILKKLGYNIQGNLSGGAYGFCYLSDDNKVIKITQDENNANASFISIGKKLEYLVNCYNVLKVKVDKSHFYVIEMEYVDTNVDTKKLDNAFKSFKYGDMSAFNKLHPNSYIRDFMKIKKEAEENDIRIDLQNSGNFAIKNNHLCVIDLGVVHIGKHYDIEVIKIKKGN